TPRAPRPPPAQPSPHPQPVYPARTGLDPGFSGINVSAYGPDYLELSGGSPGHLARLRHRLESLGLGIDIESNGTDPDHLTKLMELAGQLGARHIRTYTRKRSTAAGHSADRAEESSGQPSPTTAERMDQAVHDLRAVGPLAERVGVKVLLENHGELAGAEIAEILRRVDHPHIRAVFDYGNSMVFMEEPMDTVAVLASWAGTAHLKDHVMLPQGAVGLDRPNIMGVPVGQGNLPIVEITHRLIAAGLKRICFEGVWAYRTPSRAQRGRGVLGQGAFAYCHPPYRPVHCMVNAEALQTSDPARLVALESQVFDESVAWLAREFAKAEITLARPLRVTP
ncbi:MAG: sugar phosphate isomerase/epimerase, partial [Alphaproteobacteria bacterium]|nr:sugar phosphate isomerase/epimerase [Alphaproteobacteria bacterium]